MMVMSFYSKSLQSELREVFFFLLFFQKLINVFLGAEDPGAWKNSNQFTNKPATSNKMLRSILHPLLVVDSRIR